MSPCQDGRVTTASVPLPRRLAAELPEDAESNYELTIKYTPWIEFDVFPITTMEEAFPVIQRVYG